MTKHHEPPEAMDALSAHLDRGWDRFKKNDLAAARISAEAALAADPASPEALTLLGAILGGEGHDEAALENWRRAMELDPEYVAPKLYAAESLLGDDGLPSDEELDEALVLIEQALDQADEEEDYLDALILKAEALLSRDDDQRDDEARAALAELPPVAFPDAGFHLRAARCFLDLERHDEAEAHYQKALATEPDLADAYHGLGLVYERRDDTRAMVKAWLKVRELDLAEKPLPWALSADEFEKSAEEALAELPERIRKLLENIPIVASDYPSIEIVAEGNDPRMMGFFSGVPFPEKSSLQPSPHLDCVFLYQRNIERMCKDRDHAVAEIRITLLHETGHFFGLSEEELEEMGLG
jgi:predicted Zn-dependent protease with MMP-like domain/Flp pilus assembly protein TadD